MIEESGLLPGRMKFASEGSKPNWLVTPGMEKSFISLLLRVLAFSCPGIPGTGEKGGHLQDDSRGAI